VKIEAFKKRKGIKKYYHPPETTTNSYIINARISNTAYKTNCRKNKPAPPLRWRPRVVVDAKLFHTSSKDTPDTKKNNKTPTHTCQHKKAFEEVSSVNCSRACVTLSIYLSQDLASRRLFFVLLCITYYALFSMGLRTMLGGNNKSHTLNLSNKNRYDGE